MGKPKLQPIRKPSQVESIPEKPPIDPNDLEIEYDENETLYHPISKKEQDKEGTNVIDLEEEEEEWYQHHLSTVDPGFAQGVTFEELGMVSTFLQNDALKKGQEDEVISIVHKIQGTELFDLLENSIENVSTKIAQLLDNTLASEPINSSPTKQENIPLSDFDIEEFL
ncbi:MULTISPECIES: conjugal transfer protein TraD [unclassified Flavobacterium]|uniref:conjugal transfer protein TraD n=1 Tax=unclassified Flavobacterium TaxID=196869 RepID=UPI001F08BD0A|nr:MULTISPECIES: conjugal transfer protein TraD [unclassified Flavobacterium]